MSRLQNQVRLLVAYGLGAFFVAESFNSNFWRPHLASLSPAVRVSVGLFGLLWIIQAIVIHRSLRKQTL